MKFFNVRPLFVGAISLILGIVGFTNFYVQRNVFSIILFALTLVYFVTLIVFIVIKITKHRKFSTILICLVCLSIGAISSTIINFTPIPNYLDTTKVSGTVSSIKTYDRISYIELDNVKVDDDKIRYNVSLMVIYDDDTKIIELGNTITSNYRLKRIDKNINNLSTISTKIKYSATIYLSDISIDEKVNYKYFIKNKVKDNLDKFLNSTNSGVAYSILFGEKENLDYDTYHVFSYVGIAHILAVSGLHIGFLTTLLVMIFKLLRLKKYQSFSIIITILFIYASICNFTPSVTRAVIMATILLLSQISNRQYDGLSSLSLACILILLFNPLSIYQVGFQLSFISVFGILTLCPHINRLLSKIHCPKIIADNIAISVSVNISIFCVTLQNFGNVSIISVLANLIVLPIFSICFCVMFMVAFIGLIFPFLNYLLYIPNIILHFIKIIANVLCEINFLNFEIMHFSYIIVVIGLIAMYFYHFALVNLTIKRIAVLMSVMIVVLIAILINIPYKFTFNFVMTNIVGVGNYSFIATPNESVLVVNDIYSINNLVNDLNKYNIVNINQLVVGNYSAKYDESINNIIERYKIKTMYVNSSCKKIVYDKYNKRIQVKAIDDKINIGDIQIDYVYGLDEEIGALIDINNTNILLLNDNVTKTKLRDCGFNDNKIDYLIYNKNFQIGDILEVKCIVDDYNIEKFSNKNILDLTLLNT